MVVRTGPKISTVRIFFGPVRWSGFLVRNFGPVRRSVFLVRNLGPIIRTTGPDQKLQTKTPDQRTGPKVTDQKSGPPDRTKIYGLKIRTTGPDQKNYGPKIRTNGPDQYGPTVRSIMLALLYQTHLPYIPKLILTLEFPRQVHLPFF